MSWEFCQDVPDPVQQVCAKSVRAHFSFPNHRQQNRYSPQVTLGELLMDYSYSFGRAQNQKMLQLQH